MLLETWNQVAGWGIETIKNIQTHVGLGDEDGSNDECVPALLPAVARHSSKPEHKEAATAISSPLAALKAERDLLTKTHGEFRAQVEKLEYALSVASCNTCVDASAVAGIKAHLAGCRKTEHAHEHRLKLLEEKISQPEGFVHFHTVENTAGYIHTIGGTEGYNQTTGRNEHYARVGSEYVHTVDAVEGTGGHTRIDSSHFTHRAEAASMNHSPVAPHRGSASASPVRHTSDAHHTPAGRRLSTAGSSTLASPAASPAASHRGSASASPVRHTVLRHPSPSSDMHHRSPALRHPSPSMDTQAGRRLSNAGSFKMVSPTASRRGPVSSVRGSGSSSPVRQ